MERAELKSAHVGYIGPRLTETQSKRTVGLVPCESPDRVILHQHIPAENEGFTRPGEGVMVAGRRLLTDSWEPTADTVSWDVRIPTDDESITRRRRALAPIQVLTNIERTKGSLDGDYWDQYDLFTIALAVIDQVALAMGISAGRTWEEALDYGSTQAARQVPEASASEWLSVAERVLVSLVTTDVEIVKHLVHTASSPAWRNQRFRLLYLHPTGSEGIEHLRTSEQAINIFVEALDLDIEAAQIVNEAQLNALIARGAVESAVEIAKHARYRSMQRQVAAAVAVVAAVGKASGRGREGGPLFTGPDRFACDALVARAAAALRAERSARNSSGWCTELCGGCLTMCHCGSVSRSNRSW